MIWYLIIPSLCFSIFFESTTFPIHILMVTLYPNEIWLPSQKWMKSVATIWTEISLHVERTNVHSCWWEPYTGTFTLSDAVHSSAGKILEFCQKCLILSKLLNFVIIAKFCQNYKIVLKVSNFSKLSNFTKLLSFSKLWNEMCFSMHCTQSRNVFIRHQFIHYLIYKTIPLKIHFGKIMKNLVIQRNFTILKNLTISKNLIILKNLTILKNMTILKNLTISKNLTILIKLYNFDKFLQCWQNFIILELLS